MLIPRFVYGITDNPIGISFYDIGKEHLLMFTGIPPMAANE